MGHEFYHHGILGQKWGQRNGPPYPLSGGDYSQAEKEAAKKQTRLENSINNKKHYDKTIEKGTKLTTVSHDPNRTTDTDMFYAAYKNLDKAYYKAFLNKPMERPILDDDGNEIGTGVFFKYSIDNAAKHDLKVASEDSGIEAFGELFKNNRDFYNFVMDPDRMQEAFDKKRYGIKGYREAAKALSKIRDDNKSITSDDIEKIYPMFNYIIPYSSDNSRLTKDVQTQRAKFFNNLKKNGYSAVLDTNDAIYNSLHATAPVIVFDMDSVIQDGIKQTKITDVAYASLVSAGRKAISTLLAG